MEQGAMDRPRFMEEIRHFTEDIVAKAKDYAGDASTVAGNFHDLEAKCPKCSSTEGFKESFKAYECKACGLLVWKTMAGRELEREDVQALLEKGSVGPLEGFRRGTRFLDRTRNRRMPGLQEGQGPRHRRGVRLRAPAVEGLQLPHGQGHPPARDSDRAGV